jgi:multicomponent Na+:H+ antiporter subunit F
MNPVVVASTLILCVAFAVALVRLLIGPTLADRVLAMDLMATVAGGGICLYAMARGNYVYLDAMMVLTLIFFLGTVAFAFYLERRGGPG